MHRRTACPDDPPTTQSQPFETSWACKSALSASLHGYLHGCSMRSGSCVLMHAYASLYHGKASGTMILQ